MFGALLVPFLQQPLVQGVVMDQSFLSEPASEQRAYRAPTLITYGRISELTAAGSGAYVETQTQRSVVRQRP